MFSFASPRQISGHGAERVALAKPQIRLTVSGNRLTLAQSYFTGTAKQKNNSKARLSRKPARKFNKWLLLSQCSHNWWPEMGMDVRQRFWFHWINCYQMQAGRWWRCRVARPSAFEATRSFSVRRQWARLLPACFDKLVEHLRVERMHVEHLGKENKGSVFLSLCIPGRRLAWVLNFYLHRDWNKQTKNKMSLK